MFSRIQKALSTLLAVLLGTLSPVPLHAQTAVPDQQTGIPVFQLHSRTVVIDVVVTDDKDDPVPGLHKEDFQVTESGQPQTISFFEEHTGVPAPTGPPPPVHPDVFTNVPPTRYTDSVNVLLLDSLNTPIEDQSFVHSESIKYLKSVEPGTRIGVFTLGNELRFVQGFTTDLSRLSAALNNKLSSPQSSALLRTEATNEATAAQSDQVRQYLADTAAGGHGGDPSVASALQALEQFQRQTGSFETDLRIKQTLFAMQQLARYLAGIPGRKNVIWFSGGFPPGIFPSRLDNDDQGVQSTISTASRFEAVRQYEDELHRTDELLASSQVAIYPIAAEGVAVDPLEDVQRNAGSIAGAHSATLDQSHTLQDDSRDRNANHTTMDLIAHDTGGKAFYNTNGIKEAIDRVVHNGARYYTIAYTPTNDKMDGEYRRVRIKLASGGAYKLAYRPGYYAADEKNEKQLAGKTTVDPLHPFMGRGMPDSTQITYTMLLAPSAKQPAGDTDRVGDNPGLKAPVARYAATFLLPVSGLRLEPNPDGTQHGYVEAALVVYDYEGKAQNWEVRMIDLSIKPERYQAALKFGIPVRMEIDAPPGDMYLRSGIYDPASHAAGTLEVPLTDVVPLDAALK